MPFRKWIVEPVFLSRNAKPPDKGTRDIEFEDTTNVTLVKCLRQLGCLLEHADRIFDEIGCECRLVFERAERLSSKIQACDAAVSSLNARDVQVPVSDLTATRKCARLDAPYRKTYEQSSQLFIPSNRPRCVDKQYSGCCTSPVSVICTIDRYRTDGCTSSQLFMVTPVLGGTRRKKRKKMLDIETRKPASFSLDESAQEVRKRGCSLERSVVSPSGGDETAALDRLPSPEELTLAVSLEYPSTVVPVDVTGNSFLRMSRCRRSLIHADFEIKRKKGKHKSKRRHTVCEGENKDLEAALQNITLVNNSCQTEEQPETHSLFSFRRSFSRKKRASDIARRETVALDGLTLDFAKRDEGSATSQDRINTTKKDGQQKQSKGSLMARAAKINPISSLSAAISMAVKMRHSKSSGKQDDGRSSSGNWSASSSNRASLDSDHHHHAVSLAVDRNSNVSRSSAGKDSVISDATTATATTAHPESTRSMEHCSANEASRFPLSRTKALKSSKPLWDYDNGRESSASTPERTSDCASTPLVMSPYVRRRNPTNYYAPSTIDDGESSVYSVDTDGYYTSMHTDSGLWNVLNSLKNGENQSDSIRSRRRQESQSSVSTIGNGSINSFLSKVVTENENSSNCSSLRKEKPAPEPPPRISSFHTGCFKDGVETVSPEKFEKESSPAKNGSASESDYESRDRIRVKTTINSSRYPSLCAVSPETSDDELSEMPHRQPPKFPIRNIVVAEVHREETTEDNGNGATTKNDLPLKTVPHVINMYGGHSPTESSFTSSLAHNTNAATSTPKQKGTVSSFTSDTTTVNKEPAKESPSLVQKLVSDLKSVPVPRKDLFVTSPPVTTKHLSQTEEKSLIPLKYAQRITVTPIVRGESSESGKSQSSTPPPRSKSFLKNPLSSLPFRHSEVSSSKPKSPSYISFQSPDSPVSSSISLSPDMSRGTPSTNKAVARVTLDPMGRVIYSSSSLDRHTKENRDPTQPKYATLPKYQAPFVTSDVQTTSGRTDKEQGRFIPVPQSAVPNKTVPQPQYNTETQSSPKSTNLLFRPSRGGRFCRTYFPSHIISSSSPVHAEPQPTTPLFQNTRRGMVSTPSSANSQTAARTISNKYTTHPSMSQQNTGRQSTSPSYGFGRQNGRGSVCTVPSTYQFRPVRDSPETKYANSFSVRGNLATPSKDSVLHVSPTGGVNFARPKGLPSDSLPSPSPYEQVKTEFTPTNPPDVIPSSSTPPSTLDVTARTATKEGNTSNQGPKPPSDPSNLKSLSSSELFAIIHSSKKKHNIKSDSEKSLSPLSSRSSSPGICMTPSPVKTSKIESGVLTRHNRDRGGAASPRPENTTNASDRLGRSKPTSMRDFKMLLLQTRVGGESTTRPSAAELLKVSPPHNSGRSSPSTLPRPSSKVPSPKKDPLHVGQVHGTVPVKRMARTRSPYLTRYDSTYPPIWEDCSEDLEEADENQNTYLCPPANVNVYSTNANYSTNVIDNEKSSTHATSTWV